MTIGLKRGTVELQPYDLQWAAEFEAEKSLLESTFADKIMGIEHIGSTSIPGLLAKPIIDIIMAVDSFERLDYFIQHLQPMGYEYMPERMFVDRKFFPKGPRSGRTHHLSIVLHNDTEQWVKPIAFRDYLRSNEAERDKYAQLKRSLAAKYAQDRAAYTSAKGDFIRVILDKVAVGPH